MRGRVRRRCSELAGFSSASLAASRRSSRRARVSGGCSPVSARHGRRPTLPREASVWLALASPPFVRRVGAQSDSAAYRRGCRETLGEPTGSLVRVGSENGHHVRRTQAVRREGVVDGGSEVHFRKRAARFLEGLYPTATDGSGTDASLQLAHRRARWPGTRDGAHTGRYTWKRSCSCACRRGRRFLTHSLSHHRARTGARSPYPGEFPRRKSRPK